MNTYVDTKAVLCRFCFQDVATAAEHMFNQWKSYSVGMTCLTGHGRFWGLACQGKADTGAVWQKLADCLSMRSLGYCVQERLGVICLLNMDKGRGEKLLEILMDDPK